MHPVTFPADGGDETLRRRLEHAERSCALMRAAFGILRSTPVTIFAFDEGGICTLAEGPGADVLGLQPGAAVEADSGYFQSVRQALAGESVSTVYATQGRIFEMWFQPAKSGGAGGIAGVVGLAVDVTERRHAQEFPERDRQLSVAIEASSALSHGGPLQPALQESADALVTRMGIAFARVWTVDDQGRLELQAAAGLPYRPGSEPPSIPIAAYRVNSILASRARYVTDQVQTDPEISDPEWAARERIRAFAGYPLIIDDRAVGVLSVFDRKPLSGHTLRVIESLAGLVAQAIARKRTEGERERLLAELERERTRLAAIIENAPVGIILVEAPDARFALANPKARSILRTDIDTLTDLHAYTERISILREGRRLEPNEYPVARALFEGITTVAEELLFERGDGTSGWVRVSAVPIRDRTGRVVASVNALVDIDAEKQTEQALRTSNAELEQFAYVASHDLQEPLRMVTSYAQILARRYAGRLGPDADDFIGYIVNGAERMQSLIEALLTYSRIVHSPNTPDDSFVDVSLNRACDAAAFSVTKAMEDTNGSLEVGELPVVRGSETQLAQVFQNLLSNALKYHKPGIPPVIRISAERHGTEWTISVADNGTGFDPKYARKIFGVFKRLHGRDVPGTGIGLAICQRIVERHGGRIWAESVAGEGTTFRFTLPAIKRT